MVGDRMDDKDRGEVEALWPFLWYQWCQIFYLESHVTSMCLNAKVVTQVIGWMAK